MFEKFCIICYRKTKIEGDKMKNKYTKGFWKVCKKTCCIVAQRQAGEFVVALCRSATPDKLINEEIQANERLITASPELLEACKALMDALGDTGYDTGEDESPIMCVAGVLFWVAIAITIISMLKEAVI